jgi:PAS domain S-box-containing protein
MQLMGFYEEAFAAAPVGMLVVDSAGAIVDANRQLGRLFGYTREELLGQPVELLVDGLAEAHRKHREHFVSEPAARSMRGARDVYGRHRDGRRVPVEVSLRPVRTPEGGTLVLASVVDLTERKRAEEQFRLAIEAAPNGMLLADEQGHIVLVNAQIEQVFGYTRAELVGRSVDELLPVSLSGGHSEPRATFHAGPGGRATGAQSELLGRRKDGTQVPVEIGLSPFDTEAGHLVLASIVDITERKRAREQLQASLAEKEVLLKELHHRAKNNLQLIASLLDLASAAPGPAVLAECRDRINSIALVHEQLYESGAFATIGLRDYLQTLTEQVSHAWTRADRAPIAVHIEADDVSLPLDHAVPCGLIINELITNAYKHAFPGGRAGSVVVRAQRKTDHRILVSVADDGVGLPSQPQRGGHIGLELVYALARQLRGTIAFETGPGTRASLTFGGSSA